MMQFDEQTKEAIRAKLTIPGCYEIIRSYEQDIRDNVDNPDWDHEETKEAIEH